MEGLIEPGKFVKILFGDGKTSIQRVRKEGIETHDGNVRIDETEPIKFGSAVETNIGRNLVLLKPTLSELLSKVTRRTQVLYPKEVGYLLLGLGIGPGSLVFEAGTGSGASAAFFANFVRPNGKVVSMDVNEQSLQIASKNLSLLGLGGFVELRLGDITKGIAERGFFDAALMDLPSPWDASKAFWDLLKPSSRVAVVIPTYNQLEKTSLSLEENGFAVLECIDISIQGLKVKKGAVRPLPFARTHNAFLILAAKVLTKEQWSKG